MTRPIRNGAKAEATFYFSGACPVCQAGMSYYSSRDSEGRLAFCDVISESPAALERSGIPGRLARRRLYAIDAAGRLHTGLAAIKLLWRLSRQGWLARLADQPLIAPAAGWLYEHVVSATLYHLAERRLARRAGTRR